VAHGSADVECLGSPNPTPELGRTQDSAPVLSSAVRAALAGMDLSAERTTRITRPERCPRCGADVPQAARGRPRVWCSHTCRRAAYEERRAAATGAIAVRIVERQPVVDHDLSLCTRRVAASPAACRRVFVALAEELVAGSLRSDPKWDGTWRALERLVRALTSRTWK
jgi:endogenous inhibitor of DNA gyrase (YacG/DUF329 family)